MAAGSKCEVAPAWMTSDEALVWGVAAAGCSARPQLPAVDEYHGDRMVRPKTAFSGLFALLSHSKR